MASTKLTSSSRTCMCSPTKHPGSFRCSMHKKPPRAVARAATSAQSHNNIHQWDSSMAHFKANVSLKAILMQIIKPSSHDPHRRRIFQPKPSRFCLLNGTHRDVVAVS